MAEQPLKSFLRGRSQAALVLALLSVGATACESNLTQPDPLTAVPCEPPAMLLSVGNSQPFALGELHAAFLHAAGPMASALGSSDQVDQLILAMQQMARLDGSHAVDTVCRLLRLTSNALAALPDSPETLPDREGIRIVLMLAASALKPRQP